MKITDTVGLILCQNTDLWMVGCTSRMAVVVKWDDQGVLTCLAAAEIAHLDDKSDSWTWKLIPCSLSRADILRLRDSLNKYTHGEMPMATSTGPVVFIGSLDDERIKHGALTAWTEMLACPPYDATYLEIGDARGFI